ncbi:hypothetical protein BOX15_Mlig029041g1 [Macrostomum lignano]|uniref:Transmembrane protein n=1 Tax=Macrostomum lignano TaxID=282301 RepID=A0A267DMF8_9PLAT|nr:hypothetical protein BOX15_Mlig029041g1 [Macrostomum lignano]
MQSTMQSSVWSNPSAAGMSQQTQQQQQQQQHEHHHHLQQQHHHRDRVWTPPPQQQAATSSAVATTFRLASGRGFAASDDEPVRPSVSFPLLSVPDSVSEEPTPAIPLARRQQNYLQQRQQQLLQQREVERIGEPESEAEVTAPSVVTDEAALKLAMKRKQLRQRALIMIYLSCTLLFVLAVVFLAAFGVFHTAEVSGKEHHHDD